jgi:hypothetical protein
MRKTLARWLRGAAQRLDPPMANATPASTAPTMVFQYFGEPSTTATTFAKQLRYHVENKGA